MLSFLTLYHHLYYISLFPRTKEGPKALSVTLCAVGQGSAGGTLSPLPVGVRGITAGKFCKFIIKMTKCTHFSTYLPLNMHILAFNFQRKRGLMELCTNILSSMHGLKLDGINARSARVNYK